MIQGGQWRIPDFVRGFIHEIYEHTEGIEIGSGGKEWVWTISIDGEYRLKGTYESIRGRKPITKWHSIFWFMDNIPTHSFITWLYLGEL